MQKRYEARTGRDPFVEIALFGESEAFDGRDGGAATPGRASPRETAR